MNANLRAFLDTIAWSEIGPELLAASDNGYNVLVGATAVRPILFHDYTAHPLIHNSAMNSDVAGRYRFAGRFWDHYKQTLKLPDFGPASQDRWALQLIKECHATDDVLLGHIDRAIAKCCSRWPSFPGATYGPRQNHLSSLEDAYERAGGQFA